MSCPSFRKLSAISSQSSDVRLQTTARKSKGFTLVELLVVISIIAVLSATGTAVYTNARNSALKSKRMADIDAIKKAFEKNYSPEENGGQGGYKPIQPSDFSNNQIPTPDGGGSYIVLGPALGAVKDNISGGSGANFFACADLNSGKRCSAPSNDCYCATSTQGEKVTLNTSASCDATGILKESLVGHWKFDDGSGTTATNSAPTTGMNGTITGAAAWQLENECKLGKCLYFDGVDDIISVSNAPIFTPSSNWSVSFWARPDPSQTTWQGVINFKAGEGWGIYARHGYTGFFAPFLYTETASTGATNLYFYGSTALSYTNDWKYFTLTKTSSTYKWYVNGNLDNIQNKGAGDVTLNTTSNWKIAFSYSLRYKGYLDDIRVYGKTLNDSEVSLVYSGGSGCI